MKRVCYSQFHIGDRVFGIKEPLDDDRESHGICDKCMPLENDRIESELNEIQLRN